MHPVRRLDPDAGLTPPLIVPELVDLQMRCVYERGFQRIRTTISFDNFGPDLLAAIPYVRAARALGIDALGILGQFGFGFELARALADDELRAEVLDVYLAIFNRPVERASAVIDRVGNFAIQVLNEPTFFIGVQPVDYVQVLLAPVFRYLDETAPELVVVSAAPVGSLNGVLRVREMLLAGLESSCDVVAYHVYNREMIPHLIGLTDKPVWVTESGVAGSENHLGWYTDVFDEIRSLIPTVEHIYYFDLFDNNPMLHRLITIGEREGGGFFAEPESVMLHEHLSARVESALMGSPTVPYRDLIPDITRYFPTEEDLELIAATSFGTEGWRSHPRGRLRTRSPARVNRA